jgi:hypothetical protein
MKLKTLLTSSLLISSLLISSLANSQNYKINLDLEALKNRIKFNHVPAKEVFEGEAGTFIQMPDDVYSIAGYKNGELLIGSNNKVHRFSLTDGIIETMSIAGIGSGVYYDFEENKLIISNAITKEYLIYSDFNGDLLQRVDGPNRTSSITKHKGNYVTVSGSSYNGAIRIHNGLDLTDITRSFDVTPGTDRNQDLTSTGDYLIAQDEYRNRTTVFTDTGTIIEYFYPGNSFVWGVYYDGEKLITGNARQDKLFIHNGLSAWSATP